MDPTRSDVIVLADHSVVINGFGATPETAGFWVHRFKDTGTFIWSAAEWKEEDGPGSQVYHLAQNSEGIWVARMHDRYELTLLSVENGRPLRGFRPRRAWFEHYRIPPHRDVDGAGLLRPTSAIWDVWSNDGELWVLGATLDPEWETTEEQGYVNVGRYLDSVLDVFDAASGELIASRVIDLPNGFFEGFLPDGRVPAVETLATHNRLKLFRPVLSSSHSRSR